MKGFTTLEAIIAICIVLVLVLIISTISLKGFEKSATQTANDMTENARKLCQSQNEFEKNLVDRDSDSLPDMCDKCLGAPFMDANNNLISDACEPKDFAGTARQAQTACNAAAECKSGKCWSTVRNTCELDCYKTGECNI